MFSSTHPKYRSMWTAVLGVLAIAAVGLMLGSTRSGPEVNDDSILYVAAARNLLDGRGFSWLSGGGEVRPITGFPPAYSVLIAAVGLTGMDLFEGARIINAALFGLSAFLAGLLILQGTNSGPAALLGALLIAGNADLLLVHRWIMAEALFITLLLLSIFLLSAYLAAPRKSLALLSGLAIALAMLTRYAGVGLLPGAILGMGLLSVAGWRKRLEDCLLAAAVAALPFGILTLVNYSITGSAYHREALFEAPQYSTLVSYLNAAFSWFVPIAPDASIRLRWKVLILFSLLLVAPLLLYVRARRSRTGGTSRSLPGSATIPPLASFLSLAYLLVLAGTISSGDLGPLHLQRYVAPVFASWVVLTITVVHQVAWNRRGGWAVKLFTVALAVAFLGWYGKEGFHFLQDNAAGPLTDEYKRDNGKTVQKLQRLDPSETLYTNEIYLLYYLTYRSAYQVPMLEDGSMEGAEEDPSSQLSVFRRKMAEGAYLILFDSIDYQEGMFPSREVLSRGLVPLEKIARGKIYVDPEAHPVTP